MPRRDAHGGGTLTRWIDSTTEGPFAERILDVRSFSAATERALAHGEDRAVVLIDLGDPAEALGATEPGDLWSVLMTAAEARTAGTIRPADVLGRLADGVLAVLTEEEGGADGARRVALRLAERLDQPFNVGGRALTLRARIGIARRDGPADTAEAMFRRAAAGAR